MNAITQLRQEVCEANRSLPAHGLVTLTWGNVSAISADRSLIAIKPSGVAYDTLRPTDIVVVDPYGKVIEGSLRPSTDLPTHLVLYLRFPSIFGITHTHSPWATMFAQARIPIPCLGTTHADHFAGEVPVTRQLTEREVESGYEATTGGLIIERFATLDPAAIPGVLVAGHAPFTWGRSAADSVNNAVALEALARMAHGTLALGTSIPLEPHILKKHHDRKHGPRAYYGQ